jgi:DNA-binding MarR family transcriptional regulator
VARTSRKPQQTTLSPLYYLHVAGLRMRALLAEAMEDSPLRPEEYAVYSLLFEIGPVSATRLAREAGVPLTTALDLVKTMQRRGHVMKERDPRDGRAMSVRLTPEGLAAQRDAERYFAEADVRLRAAMGADADAASQALIGLADAADAALETLRADRTLDTG